MSEQNCSNGILVWEPHKRELITQRAYLHGHPETTLFLLSEWDGEFKLSGAFMPDAEEEETWDEQNAKMAAQRYMVEWIQMSVADKIGELRESALCLCYQIEKCGASEELTKASLMAAKVSDDLNEMLP